jgi:hypothetical protein
MFQFCWKCYHLHFFKTILFFQTNDFVAFLNIILSELTLPPHFFFEKELLTESVSMLKHSHQIHYHFNFSSAQIQHWNTHFINWASSTKDFSIASQAIHLSMPLLSADHMTDVFNVIHNSYQELLSNSNSSQIFKFLLQCLKTLYVSDQNSCQLFIWPVDLLDCNENEDVFRLCF